jgi:hypothetical protein
VDETQTFFNRIDGIPTWSFVLRAWWVAIQLVITYYVGQAGATFFYQGF